MSVRELRHDRSSGRFSKSRGLSACVSFLSSSTPPRSFTCATVVLDSLSSFFSPKPHRNACYAGYPLLFLWTVFWITQGYTDQKEFGAEDLKFRNSKESCLLLSVVVVVAVVVVVFFIIF